LADGKTYCHFHSFAAFGNFLALTGVIGLGFIVDVVFYVVIPAKAGIQE
jgi:hypothetical protein